VYTKTGKCSRNYKEKMKVIINNLNIIVYASKSWQLLFDVNSIR